MSSRFGFLCRLRRLVYFLSLLRDWGASQKEEEEQEELRKLTNSQHSSVFTKIRVRLQRPLLGRRPSSRLWVVVSDADLAALRRLGADESQCHEVSAQRAGPRGRPCKGKRDRVKKALAMVEARIQKNPEVFTAGGFFLPPAVERDPRARARVLAQWSQVAARSGRSTSTRAA